MKNTIKSKKAEVDPIKVIMIFIILAVVVAIMIYYFTTQIGKSKDITDKQFDTLGDEDKDGVANFLDKCSTPDGPKGLPEFEGCSSQSELNEKTGSTGTK